MYSRILVPLDGSPFSECSLEHLKTIAVGCRVPEVILLRAVEPLSSTELASLAEAGGDLIPEIETRVSAEAEDYITRIVDELKKEGIPVSGAVVNSPAAEGILGYADKNQIDLIIMSTHGRSGISRWAMGSVSDKVVRHSAIPVLLVSPPGCRISPK
jgi:nucleotide-binding universal stress UspA family protein